MHNPWECAGRGGRPHQPVARAGQVLVDRQLEDLDPALDSRLERREGVVEDDLRGLDEGRLLLELGVVVPGAQDVGQLGEGGAQLRDRLIRRALAGVEQLDEATRLRGDLRDALAHHAAADDAHTVRHRGGGRHNRRRLKRHADLQNGRHDSALQNTKQTTLGQVTDAPTNAAASLAFMQTKAPPCAPSAARGSISFVGIQLTIVLHCRTWL